MTDAERPTMFLAELSCLLADWKPADAGEAGFTIPRRTARSTRRTNNKRPRPDKEES